MFSIYRIPSVGFVWETINAGWKDTFIFWRSPTWTTINVANMYDNKHSRTLDIQVNRRVILTALSYVLVFLVGFLCNVQIVVKQGM
jgi:hypothetical protein